MDPDDLDHVGGVQQVPEKGVEDVLATIGLLGRFVARDQHFERVVSVEFEGLPVGAVGNLPVNLDAYRLHLFLLVCLFSDIPPVCEGRAVRQ